MIKKLTILTVLTLAVSSAAAWADICTCQPVGNAPDTCELHTWDVGGHDTTDNFRTPGSELFDSKSCEACNSEVPGLAFCQE